MKTLAANVSLLLCLIGKIARPKLNIAVSAERIRDLEPFPGKHEKRGKGVAS